jgi:hypothetical protein
MKEMYETLRGKVTLLYNEKGCRAFTVKCDLGNFKVVDYKASPLDREIYWDNATHNILNKASEEYDVAGALVNGYIQGIYEKLKPEEREKWPLVKDENNL